MTAHSQTRLIPLTGEGATLDGPAPTVHPRSLAIAERMTRAVSRIAVAARDASGLSQRLWAEVIGSTRDVVCKHESTAADDARHAPNLTHMLAMPDESLDAMLVELAKERLRLGYGARQWIAGREVIHTDETTRDMALVIELSDVLRARASKAAPHVVVKEASEALDAIQELIAATNR